MSHKCRDSEEYKLIDSLLAVTLHRDSLTDQEYINSSVLYNLTIQCTTSLSPW